MHTFRFLRNISVWFLSGLLAAGPVSDASVIADVLAQSKSVVRVKTERDSGAGIIIAPDGIVLTMAHILIGGSGVLVTLPNGSEYPAQIVYVAGGYDLVFLKVPAPGPLEAVSFSPSDELNLNSTVYSIGNSPFLRNTLSEGRITGLGQSRAGRAGFPNTVMLQMSFKSYPGDSGSPVFDSKGRLLGIIAAGKTGKKQATFAVPSDIIKSFLAEYRASKQPEAGP